MLFLDLFITVLVLIFTEYGECAPRSKSTGITAYQNYKRNFEAINVTQNTSLKVSSTSNFSNLNKHTYSSIIVFPASEEDNHEIVFPIEGEPNCSGNEFTFCEDIASYPHKYVTSVLNGDSRNKAFFGIDEGPIEHRIGDPEDTFICPSLDRTIFPKAAKNKNNKWKYIINQGEQDGYVQGVRVETCLRFNGPCNLLGSTPHGYITTCKQKYIYRRMLSLTDDGRPSADTFQMPSACCCSYRRDTAFLTNFGKRRDFFLL